MDRFRHPVVAAITAAAVLSYNFFSCTPASESTKELEKYDSYEYANEATYNRPYEATFRAAAASVEDLGFVIAISDERRGEIQGEAETDELRPEELRSEEAADESGGPIVGILAAIAFAIVMLVVSPGCETGSDDVSIGSTADTGPELAHVYVVNLLVTSQEAGTTTVSVGVARFDYEDDEFVRRLDLENKYLNHRLFDRIEELLDRDQPAVP